MHQMKGRFNHISALICAIALCVGMTVPAVAANAEESAPRRASDYLAYYSVYAIAESDGDIIIEFEVDGTGRMDSIGASQIIVQEKVGTKWKGVETYYGSVGNDMLAENVYSHISSISYTGTPGKEYRALATVYAEDKTGNDFRTVTTNSVTAKS